MNRILFVGMQIPIFTMMAVWLTHPNGWLQRIFLGIFSSRSHMTVASQSWHLTSENKLENKWYGGIFIILKCQVSYRNKIVYYIIRIFFILSQENDLHTIKDVTQHNMFKFLEIQYSQLWRRNAPDSVHAR